jgi:hypothetical protein
MLGSAMAQAKSTEPAKVAATMSGFKFKSFGGEVEMRKADHQLQQGLYITVWKKADAKPNTLQRREHRLQLPARQDQYERLRGQHAHFVPDEAALTRT